MTLEEKIQSAACTVSAASASPAAPLAQHSAGWRPIDTAPRDGTAILIWSAYGQGIAARHWAAEFTHWMPLPPPPVESGAANTCSDCPPTGYPTDKTRCLACPRRTLSSEAPTPGDNCDGEAVQSALSSTDGHIPSPHPEPEQSPAGGELDAELARWLHDELDLPDKLVSAVWPEHENDDGYRGDGGYVRLQPKDIVEHYRDAGRRLARFLARQAPAPSGTVWAACPTTCAEGAQRCIAAGRCLRAGQPVQGVNNLSVPVGLETDGFAKPALAKPAPAPSGRDEREAALWRALMRTGRITMQGSAGVDPHTLERRNGSNVHFGAEFWPEPLDQDFRDKHPESAARYDRDTRWGIACLKAMAEQILERDPIRSRQAASAAGGGE